MKHDYSENELRGKRLNLFGRFLCATAVLLSAANASASLREMGADTDGVTGPRTCGSRTISFSGHEWDVRKSHGRSSPGSNYFSDSTENAWVDDSGRLHLAITERDGLWYCAEVDLRYPLGYGTYVFQVDSRIGDLNENVVLGLFTYDSGEGENDHREIDIEFSRWGDATYPNAEYVIQPWETNGNSYVWMMPTTTESSTHSFYWNRDSIRFVSAEGHQSLPPFESIIEQWTYTKENGIPDPGDERAILNLWLFESRPPSNGIEPEVVITGFYHQAPTWVEMAEEPSAPHYRVVETTPNPFSASAVACYETDRPTRVLLTVVDISGRTVRTLVNEEKNAGTHRASWDGRDSAGNLVGAGVYFCRLQGVKTPCSKMVLLR
jgi:hypothetical protein